jgi:GTPase SAR1 family protein
MDDTTESLSVMICGLPASGKTTFLGALSHSINSQEIETSLKYDGLPADRTYLNQLAERWLSCEAMNRTVIGTHNSVELKLRSESSRISLTIPDLSGETWSHLWDERQTTTTVAELCKQSSGIVFFIHCDQFVKVQTVVDQNEQNKALGEEEIEVNKVTADWQPLEHTPTQTIVVDILQSLSNISFGVERRKLVVMLSAWDKAEPCGQTPAEYLHEHFPLLNQFLEANFLFSKVKVLGISAQGGDLNTEGEKLSEVDLPTNRIKITDHKEVYNDITLPLKWLLEN